MIEAEAGLIAIFGPNGSGKTNILEALSLLSPGRGFRRAKSEALSRQPESIGWKITAEITHPKGHSEIEAQFLPDGTRRVLIDGKASTQLALLNVARIIWLVPTMDRLWLDGAEERRKFLDRVTMSLLSEHGRVTLSYEKALRERNRLLKEKIQNPAWFDAIEEQLSETGAALTRNRLLAMEKLLLAQEDANTEFPKAGLALVTSDGLAPETDATACRQRLSDQRHEEYILGRTLSGAHRHDLQVRYLRKDMAARDCSTGEQKALLMSLVLANGRAVAQDFGAPPIFLLDEVAAHLDPARRATLYHEIKAIGAQAWMTGTEAALFKSHDDISCIIEVSESAQGSVCAVHKS